MEATTNLLESAWSYLQTSRSHFSLKPFRHTLRVIDLIKPIGELALLSYIGARHGAPIPIKELNDTIEFCWDELEEGELLYEVLISRPDLIILSSLYSTFRYFGYHNNKLFLEIQKLRNTPAYFNVDLPVWRRLDLLHSMSELGLVDGVELHKVFPNSWLAGMYQIWTLTDAAAYAVTHTIFYMSNYGINPSNMGDNIIIYLNKALPEWESYYLSEKNLDLAAEMAMSRYCIGDQTGCEEFSKAARLAQFSDGAIPGPEFGAVSLLYGEEVHERQHFLKHYHTTIVSCAAAAMHLSSSGDVA